MNKQRLQELAGIKIDELGINKPTLENQLFDEWKRGEIEVGNDIKVDNWENLDEEAKLYYTNYVQLVRTYPNADRDDVAALNSIFLYGGINGGFEEYGWNDIETAKEIWDNEMDEDEDDEDFEEDEE